MLGAPGLTAWVGLLDKASFREGDAVFVSGAAGAVGSLVGQIAKQKGASLVVGSAGSAEKVAWLTDELGYDAAFNYKDGPVVDQLEKAMPDGLDVYFDNVGGDHLEAAIAVANDHARVAACGAIAHYNDTDDDPTPGPRNLFKIVKKRLSIQGFIVTDSLDRFPAFLDEVTPWVGRRPGAFAETVVEGVDHAVEAFQGLLRGENTGKMLVTPWCQRWPTAARSVRHLTSEPVASGPDDGVPGAARARRPPGPGRPGGRPERVRGGAHQQARRRRHGELVAAGPVGAGRPELAPVVVDQRDGRPGEGPPAVRTTPRRVGAPRPAPTRRAESVPGRAGRG